MGIFGKIVGAAIGGLIGGPVGAVIGAGVGHVAVDSHSSSYNGHPRYNGPPRDDKYGPPDEDDLKKYYGCQD